MARRPAVARGDGPRDRPRRERPGGLVGNRPEVRALASSPDGERLAVGGPGARVWDTNAPEANRVPPSPPARGHCTATSPCGRLLAFANSPTGTLRIHETTTGKQRA